MNDASTAASISAVIALVLAAVWFFWPGGLGGGTTFVTTHGISMEPALQTGDLAVLRPAGSYSAGDVVAYHDEALDTIVMHRIVSGDADGFVTQGDNNDWLDEARPSQDEILGRLFFSVPQGGRALEALRSPGVLVAVGGAVLALLGAARTPRGRHGRRSSGRRAPALSMSTRARGRQVALASGAVVLVSAVSCGVLLALPATQPVTRTLQVTQQGQYSYAGAAVPGTTYPKGVIETGDTVWTKLSTGLTVSFTNTVSGPDLAGVTGAMHLDVVVSAPDGWSAVVDSGPAAALQDGTATASVGVDPDGAAALLARHYEEIGAPGGAATLTVVPVTEATGTVQGRSFTAGSPAGLEFAVDATSLRPKGDVATSFAPSTSTTVPVEEVVPRTFEVLAFSVPIDVARTVAGCVLLAALGTLGAGAWIGRTGRGDVAGQFLVRHADRILPVEAFSPGPAVVDVSDAESLHRVAERFDTVVLHHVAPEGDVFAVRDLEMTYRFVVPGTPDRRRGKPPVPAPKSVPVPVPAPDPADVTAPQPRVVPAPLSMPAAVPGRLSRRFA
jgi:signal peptidase I